MPARNPLIDQDRLIAGDIYASDEIFENLSILCDDLGSRFAGTDEERRAAEFIRERFEAYGLRHVTSEPFEFEGWQRGQAKLEITRPIPKEIECISLPHCPTARVSAALVDLEDGAPADFEKRRSEIKGRIVLVSSEAFPKGAGRWVHRQEKYGRSLLAEAAGFVFFNHYPGYGPATGCIGHGGYAPIPGISVSRESGTFLQRLMRRRGEVRVRLTTTDRRFPASSANVLAEMPGTEHRNQVVMLGCHFDGHDIAQGAEDPVSGLAAMMAAARALGRHAGRIPRTIRFAAWGAEEVGLVGSRAYVADHADQMKHIRFYLNLDSAGAAANKGVALNEWPELEPLFERWSAEMAHPFGIKQAVHAHSDHYPFLAAGVPTGGIESVPPNTTGRGYGHTRHDTLDKVSVSSVREAAALAARLALRLACEPSWPVRHRTGAQVADLFGRMEYREEVKLREAAQKLCRPARPRKR